MFGNNKKEDEKALMKQHESYLSVPTNMADISNDYDDIIKSTGLKQSVKFTAGIIKSQIDNTVDHVDLFKKSTADEKDAQAFAAMKTKSMDSVIASFYNQQSALFIITASAKMYEYLIANKEKFKAGEDAIKNLKIVLGQYSTVPRGREEPSYYSDMQFGGRSNPATQYYGLQSVVPTHNSYGYSGNVGKIMSNGSLEAVKEAAKQQAIASSMYKYDELCKVALAYIYASDLKSDEYEDAFNLICDEAINPIIQSLISDTSSMMEGMSIMSSAASAVSFKEQASLYNRSRGEYYDY